MLPTPRRAARVLLVDGAGRILLWYRQEQDYFLAWIGSWMVVTDGFDADEARSIDGHRWWAVDGLETTSERYYPAELPGLLRRVLEPLPAEVRPVTDEAWPC